MAVKFKRMAFSTPEGVQYPELYWRLVDLSATLEGMRLVYYGWLSKADAEARAVRVAEKSYTFPPGLLSQFDELETLVHEASWAVVGQTPEGDGPPFFTEAVDA